jgi:hypothetical protein
VDARIVAPITRALKTATEEAQAVAAPGGESAAAAEPPSLLSSLSAPAPGEPGEGIGLAIVKRLCELLDATLELHAEPGKGSTFRILFPRQY